jgi:hypothetical protein
VTCKPQDELKSAYLGLASLDCTIACQCAWITCPHDGDTNTAFDRWCTYRMQKERIHDISVEGQTLTDHADIAEAAFMLYDGLLGTDIGRDCSLDFAQLIEPADGLDALEAPFSTDEIWNAVKRMPALKV